MITSERLEELIKQGATIFEKYGNKIVLKGANSYFVVSQNGLAKMNKTPNFGIDHWGLNEIFETKDRTEWALKTVAERTERFEPPMWEDIEEHYTFDWLNKGHHYRLAVDRPHQCIVITDFTIKEDIFDELAAKENYEKACGIVRRLFSEEVK